MFKGNSYEFKTSFVFKRLKIKPLLFLKPLLNKFIIGIDFEDVNSYL